MTANTIIVDVDVWAAPQSFCDSDDGCCSGFVLVEVGFRWRGRFKYIENENERGGLICDFGGASPMECTDLRPTNNGKEGERFVQVSC